jgi:hypothetical protein
VLSVAWRGVARRDRTNPFGVRLSSNPTGPVGGEGTEKQWEMEWEGRGMKDESTAAGTDSRGDPGTATGVRWTGA